MASQCTSFTKSLFFINKQHKFESKNELELGLKVFFIKKIWHNFRLVIFNESSKNLSLGLGPFWTWTQAGFFKNLHVIIEFWWEFGDAIKSLGLGFFLKTNAIVEL